jgi:hypothetical protein
MFRFSSLLLSLLLFQSAFSQDPSIALITNPEIGANGNEQNLLAVVDSINQNPAVSHVVVLGNITSNGVFDEFVWAQEILDGLTVPYSVVGGVNDYSLSEGRGSEISLLWGDEKSFISNNNLSVVCLNTFIPELSDKKFVDVEILDWFVEKIRENKSTHYLTFSYYPLKIAENSFQLFEKVAGNKLYSFVARKDNSIKEKSLSEGFYLNRHSGWGYSIITVRSDSVIIKNFMTANSNKFNSQKTISSFASVQADKPKEKVSNISTLNERWSISYNLSTITSSIYSGDKIFNGLKAGKVVCIDRSGKEKWTYQTNGRIYSSPVIENDLILTATNEGDLLSLNANTGSLVHVIGIGETITSEICIFDVEDDGIKTKTVIVGTANGNLYCYDLYTLEPMWINQSANKGTANPQTKAQPIGLSLLLPEQTIKLYFRIWMVLFIVSVLLMVCCCGFGNLLKKIEIRSLKQIYL